MNIKNKIYPVVTVSRQKVPEFNQSVKVENGVIYVTTVDEDGKQYWTKADRLKTDWNSDEDILEHLLWELQTIQSKLNMSKAALKRELVKYSLISK